MSDGFMLVHEDATTDLLEQRTVEAVRADRFVIEGNKIKDVHLVGFQAKNIVKPAKTPYTYTPTALKEAVALYENVDIYVNHAKDDDSRDAEDKIGFISAPKFKEGTGITGDLVLNPKHVAYESFMWWAANKPSKLAMSHVALTKYDAKENAMVAVAKVYSVDFVSDGSTTHDGLFKEGVLTDKIKTDKWFDIIVGTAWDAIYEAKYPLGKTLTQEQKAVSIIPVVKDLLDELSKMVPAKSKESVVTTTEIIKEHTMEFADITLDALRKARKDLVDAIATEAVDKHIEVEESVADALKGVPADACSDTFKTLVREAVVAGNDKRVAELVEDRKGLATKVVAVVEAAPAPARKSHTTESKPADTKSIAALAKKKN